MCLVNQFYDASFMMQGYWYKKINEKFVKNNTNRG